MPKRSRTRASASSIGRNIELTPFGIATTLAGSSRYWSITSARVNSETAITRSARRTEPRTSPSRERSRRENNSGARA